MLLPAPFTWSRLSWCLCLHLPSADLYLSQPELYFSPWVVLFPSISWCPSLLSNVSRAGPFFCPASSLTLQGTIDPDRDAVGQHMWLSPHPNLFPHLNFFFPHVLVACHSFTMDLGDRWQEEQLDTSPSVSSDSSWTSFDLSTDLTSVSSDQVSTPIAAPSGYEPFGEPPSLPSIKVSSGKQTSVLVWRETSFLGNDE